LKSNKKYAKTKLDSIFKENSGVKLEKRKDSLSPKSARVLVVEANYTILR
jgi:hypothetical protein